MPEIGIDIEIYCEECGEGICNNATPVKTYNRGQPAFRVMSCSTCIERAKEESYEEGKKEGYEERCQEET